MVLFSALPNSKLHADESESWQGKKQHIKEGCHS